MKIIECPRDAMQGLPDFIETGDKARYINALLKVGFHTIDFGSFVSPKAIPQMRDTAQLLDLLDLSDSTAALLAIVANLRGAQDAAQYEQIKYVGFPLSISETFQQRNTNKSIAQALSVIDQIQEVCRQQKKELVVYVSMGFGNPYGEPYSAEVVALFVEKLAAMGVGIVSLSDTIGVSVPEQIRSLFETLIPAYPAIEMGAHFHSNPNTALQKVAAAYQAGCRRLDGALGGMGGCPMAKDELTGNIATETIIGFLQDEGGLPSINLDAFWEAVEIKRELFG